MSPPVNATARATNLFRRTAGAGGEPVFRAIGEAGATGIDAPSPDDDPGLAQKHPALIAGVLFRDRRMPRDESTLLAARESGRRGAQ